ncbi:MAG: ABC transporter substrate-binding protein [Sedimentisphaerales bacterium]|nr:ABC transporter substrate-binding protein [Sedimentisphaerales bacterium]
MKKWWILLVMFITWIGLGCVLLRPGHAHAALEGRPSHAPARIVSMAPNLTEILFSLGLEENLVGVTQDSDYPPAATRKPAVGTFWQPNIEAVIALRPDLVVAMDFEQQRSLTGRLARMGYHCLTLDTSTVSDLFEAISTVAAATGKRRHAERVIKDMKAKVASVANTTTGRDQVRVLWVVQRDPLRVAGRGTFINETIELAGGENAIGPSIYMYPPIGGEQVIASAPQVIIEPSMLGGDLREHRRQAISYWGRYPTVPAVANGRIYVIDGDLVSRLGPRLGDAIEVIAKCLRPELFGE